LQGSGIVRYRLINAMQLALVAQDAGANGGVAFTPPHQPAQTQGLVQQTDAGVKLIAKPDRKEVCGVLAVG